MPELENPQHETFAQALAAGADQAVAYMRAGYKKDRGNAAKLAARPAVRERVEELQAEAAERDTLARGEGPPATGAAELHRIMRGAVAAGNWSAAAVAARTIAESDGSLKGLDPGDGMSPPELVRRITETAGGLPGYMAAKLLGMTEAWSDGNGQPLPDRIEPIEAVDKALDDAEAALRRARRG